MKTIKYLFFLLFLAQLSFAMPAADCTTIADGDFNDDAIWDCGSAPGKADNVTISHNVNLNVSFTGGGKISGNWTVDAGASIDGGSTYSLEFGSGTSTINGNFEVNNLSINNGAALSFSSTSTVNVNGNFTNDNNSDEVTVNTSNFDVGGNMSNGNGGTIVGTGQIDVTGTVTNAGTGTILGCVGAACCGGGCVLLVDLLSLTVEQKKEKVFIKWATASEIDNDYFIVEKSFDGIVFNSIGIVQGAGNSSVVKSYQFVDNELSSEKKAYYRITDVDFSGIKTSHSILVLNYKIDLSITTIDYRRPYLFIGNIPKGSTMFSVGVITAQNTSFTKRSLFDVSSISIDLNPGLYFASFYGENDVFLKVVKFVVSH